MCQLTYIQIPKYKQLKGALLNSLLRMNSMAGAGHKDGFGIFSNSYINKRGVSADDYKDIYKLMAYDELPVIGHVRKASFGYNKKIGFKFAHPFLYKDKEKGIDFVLAHNGTLELKEGKIPDDFIDSNYFGEEVFKRLKDGANFVDAFTDTLDLFTGKFAFLLWHNATFYVARGRTATLFKSNIKVNGKPAGFVINTERNSLLTALLLTTDFLGASRDIEIEYEMPIIVDANKMYRVSNPFKLTFEDSLTELKVKIREKTAYEAKNKYTQQQVNRYQRDHYNEEWWNQEYGEYYNRLLPEEANSSNIPEATNDLEELITLLGKYDISVLEIDHMFKLSTGKGILEVTLDDLEIFCNTALPVIRETVAANRIKVFKGLLADNKMTERQAYTNGVVPFPNFLLGPKALRGCFSEYLSKGQE